MGSVLDPMRSPHAQAEHERVDVNALVQWLVQSLVDDLAEQGQPATFGDAAADAAHAVVGLARPAALSRLLGNLMGNALPHGGTAQVSVAVLAGEAQIVIDGPGPGPGPGPGITEHPLDAVFQPFHRVDASRRRDAGGVGLGLYIACDLAQRNGGPLALVNRAQGGLRATLVLPLASRRTHHRRRVSAPAQNRPPQATRRTRRLPMIGSAAGTLTFTSPSPPATPRCTTTMASPTTCHLLCHTAEASARTGLAGRCRHGRAAAECTAAQHCSLAASAAALPVPPAWPRACRRP